MSRRSRRFEREGESSRDSNRRLPLAQERVRSDLLDRRFYHPAGDRLSFDPVYPAGLDRFLRAERAVDAVEDFRRPLVSRVSGGIRRLAPIPARRVFSISDARPVYRFPRRTLSCVVRKVRREVLFAYRVAGSRGGMRHKWRRTESSNYSC